MARFLRRLRDDGPPTRTDAVTGCLDAYGFEERLDAELALGGRRGQPTSVVLVELTDTEGGRDTLKWAAARLLQCPRPGDALARLRGGEFALLLPATVKADARAVASRARSALSLRMKGGTGVAGYPEDGVDGPGLLAHARGELHPSRR